MTDHVPDPNEVDPDRVYWVTGKELINIFQNCAALKAAAQEFIEATHGHPGVMWVEWDESSTAGRDIAETERFWPEEARVYRALDALAALVGEGE